MIPHPLPTSHTQKNYCQPSKGQKSLKKNIFLGSLESIQHTTISLSFFVIPTSYNDDELLVREYDAEENVQKISDLLFFNPFHCFCCFLFYLFHLCFPSLAFCVCYCLLISALLIHSSVQQFFYMLNGSLHFMIILFYFLA